MKGQHHLQYEARGGADTIAAIAADPASAWDTSPAEGTSLFFLEVMLYRGLSGSDIVRTIRLHRGNKWQAAAVTAIARGNRWPKLMAREALEAQLRDALHRLGVSAAELAHVFHARACIAAPKLPRGRRAVQPQEPEAEVLLPKQTLAPQSAKHFKLFRNPFDGPVERPEQFFCSDEIAFVRESMWQCAIGAGFLAVIGESGSGKTTILADMEERLASQRGEVVLMKPGVLGMEGDDHAGKKIKATDLLHAIISTLEPGASVPQTLQARTLRAQQLLTASASAGRSHLLVIEEAHGMPDHTLKHLKRMHELRNGRRSLLGVLLIAQPELKVRLADGLRAGTLREVAQRCEIVELMPLEAELQGYLACRAQAAGRRLETITGPDAVEALRARLVRKVNGRTLSFAYPLAVNNWITRAMNLAADIGAPAVTGEVIRAI